MRADASDYCRSYYVLCFVPAFVASRTWVHTTTQTYAEMLNRRLVQSICEQTVSARSSPSCHMSAPRHAHTDAEYTWTMRTRGHTYEIVRNRATTWCTDLQGRAASWYRQPGLSRAVSCALCALTFALLNIVPVTFGGICKFHLGSRCSQSGERSYS